MTSPPIAGATHRDRAERLHLGGERRAEFFHDGHLLQRERALKKLAAVQPAAQDEMAFEQRAASREKFAGLRFVSSGKFQVFSFQFQVNPAEGGARTLLRAVVANQNAS
jgi:hypothetical protein